MKTLHYIGHQMRKLFATSFYWKVDEEFDLPDSLQEAANHFKLLNGISLNRIEDQFHLITQWEFENNKCVWHDSILPPLLNYVQWKYVLKSAEGFALCIFDRVHDAR